MNSILAWAIGVVIPFVVGALTKPAYDLFEKFIPPLESKLPTWLKPLTVSLLAAAFTWLSKYLNVVIPADITTWTPDTIHGLLAAGFAMIIHIALGSKSVVTPTAPTA